MSMYVPASVLSDTRRTVWLAGGAADPENVEAGELALGADLSLDLVKGVDGFNGARSQEQISDSRQGSPQDFQKPGRKSATLSIRYVFDDTDLSPNTALNTLVEGAIGAFVYLRQVQEDYDPATDGDYAGFTYEYWPVQLGLRVPLPPDPTTVDYMNQSVSVTGKVVTGVVVAGS